MNVLWCRDHNTGSKPDAGFIPSGGNSSLGQSNV